LCELARISERQDKPGRSRGDQVRDPPPKA
jgi:hypothetical protein